MMGKWIEQRRALIAWLVLLVLLAVGYVAIDVLVFQKYRYYEENADGLSDQLRRLRAIAARRPAVEKKLSAVRRTQPAQGNYLAQSTSALAAAELQERVKGAVESSGGKLVSTQNLPVDTSGQFPQVTIKVRASGGVEAAQRLFHDLESGKPQVVLDNVVIQARTVRRAIARRRARGQVNVNTDTELDISFDLSGFMRVPQGDAG